MWPLNCSQAFSSICPDVIVFDPHDPVSNSSEISPGTNFLSKFHKDRALLVNLIDFEPMIPLRTNPNNPSSIRTQPINKAPVPSSHSGHWDYSGETPLSRAFRDV